MKQTKRTVGQRLKSFFGFGTGIEASNRGPFYGQGELGNWFALGPLEDGWQRNLDVQRRAGPNATAFACRSLLSSLGASLPFYVVTEADNGSRSIVKNTDVSRVLVNPNRLQTSFEFFEMVIWSLLTEGNAYLLKTYNDRYGISELLPVSPRAIVPYNMYDEGEQHIFYAYSGGFFRERLDALIPERDVIHLRINADPLEPLRGRSPLEYAACALGLHAVIAMGLTAYHNNASRVGALLTTDAALTPDQIDQLKAAWADSAQGWQRGKTVVLPGGLKTVDLSQQAANAADQRLTELMAASNKDIARCFRVPPELLGLDSTSGRSPEEASRWLLTTALGPLLEVIEQGLTRALRLDGATSWIEADTLRLLRIDEGAKWAAIETSIRAGVRTINEARRSEGLPPVKGGDQPLVQQQDLPLGLSADFARATIDRMEREAERNNPTAELATEQEPEPDPEEKLLDLDQVKDHLADRMRVINNGSKVML